MNRRLIWLNLALAVLAGFLVWQLRVRRQQAAGAEKAVLEKQARAQVVLPPPPPAPVPAVAPAQYIDTVQNMLFSKDRNPNVIKEVEPPPPPPPPPPPMPALPYYYGQIHFGGPALIELRPATGKEAQKGYQAGDKIGDFTVVAFDRDTVTFDWNGEQVVRNLSDLKPKEAQPQTQQQATQPQASAAPASASASSGVTKVGGSDASQGPPANLGQEVGGGYFGCKPGDTTPTGTVVSGYKINRVKGFMGAESCIWEKVNQ